MYDCLLCVGHWGRCKEWSVNTYISSLSSDSGVSPSSRVFHVGINLFKFGLFRSFPSYSPPSSTLSLSLFFLLCHLFILKYNHDINKLLILSVRLDKSYICTQPWHNFHNQDNKHIHNPQNFLKLLPPCQVSVIQATTTYIEVPNLFGTRNGCSCGN